MAGLSQDDVLLWLGAIGGPITAVAIAGAFLWKRHTRLHRSFRVRWRLIGPGVADIGRGFQIDATIQNRTRQTRPFTIGAMGRETLDRDPVGPPSFGFDGATSYHDDLLNGDMPAVPPDDEVRIRIELPSLRYGTDEVAFRITGRKGVHQDYASPWFVLRVEKPEQSDWARMSPGERDEFAARVLSDLLERIPRSRLTRRRVIEFYDLVEAGRMVIAGGALWQSFPGLYSKWERRHLLMAARTRGVYVRWAERSEPLGFWMGLLFRNA